jgi:hypothetical protein
MLDTLGKVLRKQATEKVLEDLANGGLGITGKLVEVSFFSTIFANDKQKLESPVVIANIKTNKGRKIVYYELCGSAGKQYLSGKIFMIL